jgi:hypothetical protein
MRGARIRFEFPHLANLPCSECQKWVYDLKTGKQQLYGGKPVRQHPSGPPCVQEPGICPKGEPGKSDLTYQNLRVLRHFEECRAVGGFPDDGLVKMHAGLLEPIYQDAERRKQNEDLSVKIARLVVPMRQKKR